MIDRLALPVLCAASGTFTAVTITQLFGTSLVVCVMAGTLCALFGAAMGAIVRMGA